MSKITKLINVFRRSKAADGPTINDAHALNNVLLQLLNYAGAVTLNNLYTPLV